MRITRGLPTMVYDVQVTDIVTSLYFHFLFQHLTWLNSFTQFQTHRKALNMQDYCKTTEILSM